MKIVSTSNNYNVKEVFISVLAVNMLVAGVLVMEDRWEMPVDKTSLLRRIS